MPASVVPRCRSNKAVFAISEIVTWAWKALA
jgi:hypothetical protein